MGKSLIRDMEERVAAMVIETASAAGYELRVMDGEEIVTPRTADKETLMKAMFSTDEDYLFFYKPGVKERCGWVRFIYGNDGYDVINDYTTNLEEVLAPVNAFTNQYF